MRRAGIAFAARLGDCQHSVDNRRLPHRHSGNARFVIFSSRDAIAFVELADAELFPSDEATPIETYKQRFFQLINNSEVSQSLVLDGHRDRMALSLQHIVSTTLLMERLEIESLESLDLIVSREQFKQKYVRIKTRL